jgi:hypothetical protein
MGHGISAACAYLVIAQGTASDNKKTAWSTNSVMTYAGLGWEGAKQAIETLVARGFIRHGDGHTADRPRYELLLFSEFSELDLKRNPPHLTQQYVLDRVRRNVQPRGKSERAAAEELLRRGLLVRNGNAYGDYSIPPAFDDDPKHLIWLPNSIVLGSLKGEESPVKRLRRTGDIWALRLFVDFYHAQNLRDDGGIGRHIIRQKFERHRTGEHGAYIIWGFERKGMSAWWKGPLSVDELRPKASADLAHPVWETIRLLERLRLLSFVPHVFENDTDEAQPLHAYGINSVAEAPIEREIAIAADAAARVMCFEDQVQRMEEDHNCEHFCPVINTLPKAQMVGVARLTYRPHTKRTGAWFAELTRNAPVWIERYWRIAATANGGTAKHGMMA